MLFLGPELLYFLYICHVADALSVPASQGKKDSATDEFIKAPPKPAKRSTARLNSRASYRTIFHEYPTIDKISKSTEDQQSSAAPLNDISNDNISQSTNQTDAIIASMKYALDTPANPPLLINVGKLELPDGESEKMELHTNNHQSLNNNNHISRHYNTYMMAGGSSGGSNPLYYSSGNNLNKYGSSTGSLANTLSLNYIHNLLLAKPNSGSNPLSNLLNYNANSLNLATSQYGMPLQANYVSSSLHSSILHHTPSNSVKQPTNIPATTTTTTTYAPPLSILNDITEPISLNSIDLPVNTLSCGKQQVSAREPRIVGGNSTYEGEFPWAVSIQRQGNHHCGGVIVGKRWILTAAHCVRSQLIGNLVVRTGGHTLSRSINHINSHLSRDYLVDQIVVHDDFSRYDNLTASQMKSSANTNNADIALLRLKNDILWNELAWPVCFPNMDSGNFSGHDATVIGWGKLNEKSEDFSNELQKVRLTIIDNKVCQNWFRQAGRDMPIDDRIICAGFKNGGKDACHGDSGGPLLSKINGHYTVVGVVSTGIGCARPLLPGLYSRVSSYIRWIEKYVS